MLSPKVNIDADGDLKDFMNATCDALVKIREEIHGLRLGINALRYQISPSLSEESTSYPVKFPTDTVEDLQLLTAKLEDITSHNTLHPLMTDELANIINWMVSITNSPWHQHRWPMSLSVSQSATK
ncbi:hypothetical protein EG68_00602 [Paragonimus skrjabini miyazakii]|uniref:Uncharacterized protein n=1 Tax=Paragonimus skrjabini miyazakii TaxID=59628 RepID=A0A8S9Z8F0_9TREM|nr:hypothetical protein EG68_00602 [Paragonimus skrjabini miyazakii]